MSQEIKGVGVMKKIMTLLLVGSLIFGAGTSILSAAENPDYHSTGKVGFFGEYDESTDSSEEPTTDTSDSTSSSDNSNQPNQSGNGSSDGSGISKLPQTGEQVKKSSMFIGLATIILALFLILWKRRKKEDEQEEKQ